MDKTTLSLIIGIAGSLIATGIFIGISEFIRRVFLPWYADMIYRGVRIDGDWRLINENVERETNESTTFDQTLTLKQSGENVTGNTYIKVGSAKIIFEFSGRIRNMYLSGVSYPVSKRHIDPQTFLFHIDYVGGSLRLTGVIAHAESAGKISANGSARFNHSIASLRVKTTDLFSVTITVRN